MTQGVALPPQPKKLVVPKEKALDAALECITTAKNILLKKIEEDECPSHNSLFQSLNNAIYLIKEWQDPNYGANLEKRLKELEANVLICKHCGEESDLLPDSVVSNTITCPSCSKPLLEKEEKQCQV